MSPVSSLTTFIFMIFLPILCPLSCGIASLVRAIPMTLNEVPNLELIAPKTTATT
jgi:hypothetical protein